MNKRRKIQDNLLNGLTILCTSIAVFVLAAIFIYVFQKGFSTLSWQMMRSAMRKKTRFSSHTSRMTALFQSSIEMLSGVPSIIFGLMGIAVFFCQIA